MREKNILYAHKSVLIDPVGCGSTISYRICYEGYFNAEIALADCTHKISWFFGEGSDSVEKIDAAIKTLQAFKKDLLKAQAAAPRKKP